MLIVKLAGGPDNQMFQNAVARRLAPANQTQLKIDRSWFSMGRSSNLPGEYALDVFSVPQLFATEREIAASQNRGNRYLQFLRRMLHIAPSLFLQSHFIEPHVHFDERAVRLKGDVNREGS